MKILTELELEEVSLVDRPANPGATISLFKSCSEQQIETKEFSMTEEEIKALEAEVETLKGEVSTLKSQNEGLRKGLIDNGFKITAEGIEKKAPENYVVFKGEKIVESDDRYELAKALNEVEIEKADIALEKNASETLPNVPVDKAKRLLKSFSEDEEFMQFLRSIDALFDNATKEIGKSAADGDMADPKEKLEKALEAKMTEKNINKAQAYAELASTKEGSKLISDAYKKGE